MNTPTIRLEGATEDDRAHLLNEVVHPFILRVCRDRNWKAQRWLKAEDFDELPEYEYVALASKKYAPVLIIDVDDNFAPEQLSNLNFVPNWIGINPESNHYQVITYLDKPVLGTNEYPPRRHYDSVQRGLSRALEGDNHFARNLARNPLSNQGGYDWHLIHHDSYSMEDLLGAALAAGTMIQPVTEERDRELAEDPRRNPRAKRGDVGLSVSAQLDIGRYTKPLPRASGPMLTEPTYDGSGQLMRSQSLFLEGQAMAIKLRRQGHVIDSSFMFAYLAKVNDELGRLDRRGRLANQVLMSTATSVTNWGNRVWKANWLGAGTYGAPYSHAQRVSGGRTRGAQNAIDGTLERARQNSIAARSAQAIVDVTKICMMRDAGLGPKQIENETGYSRSKVKSALKGRTPSS